ncbi:Transcriptional regulator GlxA family, contains an amidase domain and an AraC-type DNA-binding HTH domain [Streptomyces sp. 1331.2]|nr:Transcriptional regulator GlxA family, contains an amidase domain and an AraC-type DNA-binding HTH domain [Streptomyces sp. 1331.2]
MSRVSRSDASPDSGQAVAGTAGRPARSTGTSAIATTRSSGAPGAAAHPSYPATYSAAAHTPAVGSGTVPGGAEHGAATPHGGQSHGAQSHGGGQPTGGQPVSRGPVSHAPAHGGDYPGYPGYAGYPGQPGYPVGVPGQNGAPGANGGPLGGNALGTGSGHGPLGHGGLGANGSGANSSASTVTISAPRKLSGRRRRETVAVLIFGGAPIFESSIPLSVFGVDRQDAGVPRYRLLVCAGEEGPLATTGGLTLSAPYGLEALARAGTIVVPAWRSISQPPPVEAITALRKAHHEGARIIGLCTGAFVLAAAGLLDGRPATTHWMYAPTLAKRYPRVHVDPRELFVDDGDVLTSAGTAAGIDLCLHVVRSDHGAEAANALARRLVVPSRRGGGGQAQYIDQSLPEEIGNDPLAEVVTWALENLNQQFDVEVLAARAYMSRRTFDRRFRTLTGSAPLQWLITQRVLQAQRLLETSELSVDDVARRCGFRSPVALRGHFRRQLGVSPAAYRTSYRARRPGQQPPTAAGAHGGDLRLAGALPHAAAGAAGMAGGSLFAGAHGAQAAQPFPGGPGAQAPVGPHGQPAHGQPVHGQQVGHGQPGAHGQSGAHGQPAGYGPGQAGTPAAAQAFHARAGQPYPHQQAAQQSHPGQQGAVGRGPVRGPVVPPQIGPGAGAGRPPRTAEHAAAEDGHPQPGARGQGQGHRSAVERPADEPGTAGRGHGAAAGRLPSPAGQPAAGAGELRGRQARAPQAVRPQGGRAGAEGARAAREARPGRDGHPVRTGREGEHPDGPGTHDGAEEHQAEATAAAPRSAPPVPAARDRAVG